MGKLIIILLCMPLITISQVKDVDIDWNQELTWEQVKAKARDEKKYIFIDAYATWCAPCKSMDNDVFSLNEIRKFLKSHFVILRVQMDSSIEDNKYIKNWYESAQVIKREYGIEGFPTFLFFTPNGKLIYKSLGYKKPQEFVSLATKAFDPNLELYYDQLEKYNRGEKAYKEMGRLAIFVYEILNDKKKAKQIAKDYNDNYLEEIFEEDIICSKYVDLDFLYYFRDIFTPDDKIFNEYFKHALKVDSVIQRKGWSDFMVKSIITKCEIESKTVNNGRPTVKVPVWKDIQEGISLKYPNIDAKRLILDYQINYYKDVDINWNLWATCINKKIKLYPPISIGTDVFVALNLPAWHAFKYCNDRKILKKALKWTNLAISIDGKNASEQLYDTKANLLYKLGKPQNAIIWEEKAIEIGTLRYEKEGRKFNTSVYQNVIAQMRRGDPTYLNEGAIWDIK